MSSVGWAGSPHGVEDPAVSMDPEEFIRRGHSVKVGLLAVEEVSVRHPESVQDVDGHHQLVTGS